MYTITWSYDYALRISDITVAVNNYTMAPSAVSDDRSKEYLHSSDDVPLDKDLLEPIAIIGFSLKFPQDATSAESFWEMLMEGRSAMTKVPGQRFNVDSFYVPGTKRQDEVCYMQLASKPALDS
jgi:Beta-ketoacyl synthase, N-terminal domain